MKDWCFKSQERVPRQQTYQLFTLNSMMFLCHLLFHVYWSFSTFIFHSLLVESAIDALSVCALREATPFQYIISTAGVTPTLPLWIRELVPRHPSGVAMMPMEPVIRRPGT